MKIKTFHLVVETKWNIIAENEDGTETVMLGGFTNRAQAVREWRNMFIAHDMPLPKGNSRNV